MFEANTLFQNIWSIRTIMNDSLNLKQRNWFQRLFDRYLR
jgi:hypothetical protein